MEWPVEVVGESGMSCQLGDVVDVGLVEQMSESKEAEVVLVRDVK